MLTEWLHKTQPSVITVVGTGAVMVSGLANVHATSSMPNFDFNQFALSYRKSVYLCLFMHSFECAVTHQ